MIVDAGQLLPYAKKHLHRAIDTRRQDGVSLEQLWPEPNWKELFAGRMPVEVVVGIYLIRSGLSPKPREASRDISSVDWFNAYVETIPVISELLLESKTGDDIKLFARRLATRLGYSFDKLSTDHPRENIKYWACGRGSRSLKSVNSFTARQRVLQRWMAPMGWPESDRAIQTGVVPIEMTNGSWHVGRIEGMRYVGILPDVCATEAEALELAIIESDRILSGVSIPKRHSIKSAVDRVGPDYRFSEDICLDSMILEFGFRGVQFGSTLRQAERQTWVNETYSALSDLAAILGMERKWIGLAGLGLAFGARGSGSAIPHYEPTLRVINLTRKNGASCMCHEWGHGLDHKLARTVINPKTEAFLSEMVFQYGYEDKTGDPRKRQLLAAMTEIMEFIRTSEYLKSAMKIGAERGAKRGYWDKPEELFARAFEAYVEDTLLSLGLCSPVLVQGTLESDYDLKVVAACPYPVGQERVTLNNLFRQFTATLITK